MSPLQRIREATNAVLALPPDDEQAEDLHRAGGRLTR